MLSIDDLKDLGNEAFKTKDYASAVARYTEALDQSPVKDVAIKVSDFYSPLEACACAGSFTLSLLYFTLPRSSLVTPRMPPSGPKCLTNRALSRGRIAEASKMQLVNASRSKMCSEEAEETEKEETDSLLRAAEWDCTEALRLEPGHYKARQAVSPPPSSVSL